MSDETVVSFEDLRKAREEAGIDWLAECQREGLRVLPTVANALLALRSDKAWRGVFGFNEFTRETVLRKPLPDGGAAALTELDEVAVSRVLVWLQQRGIMRMTADATHRAVDIVARENPFHPVRDWLDALLWDGKPRLDTWLRDCLGSPDDDYTKAISRMFPISMAARVQRPGCKADYMPVLESDQGEMKSAACAILVGADWFSDSLPENVASKDARVHLRGKWLIEAPEMSAMNRSEIAAMKAFLTRREEKYRPPYGRREVTEPRQCAFIGTTNLSEYLRDETGGRRFWPVAVGAIDLGRIRDCREQLFAEAMAAYRSGEHWWPSRAFEAKWIAPAQEERRTSDAWEEPIAAWLTGKDRVTLFQVARNCLLFENDRDIKQADQIRIRACLHALGWRRGQRTGGQKWFVPPPPK